MAVSPTGPLSLPLGHLKMLLAASSTFANWIGSSHVRFVEVTAAEDKDLRPWALIDQGSDWERTKFAADAARLRGGGSLLLRILADVPTEHADDAADSQFWFTNQLGVVVQEIEELAGSDAYLNVTGVNLIELERADESVVNTEGDYVTALFEVSWGI